MALREAARWAAHFRARLTLLHVLAPAVIPVSVTEMAAVYEVMPGLQERLQEELTRWIEAEVPETVSSDVRIEEGPVDLTILEQARQEQADLIVMATHGRSGVARWLLGSVTERVLRQAPVRYLPSAIANCLRSLLFIERKLCKQIPYDTTGDSPTGACVFFRYL